MQFSRYTKTPTSNGKPQPGNTRTLLIVLVAVQFIQLICVVGTLLAVAVPVRTTLFQIQGLTSHENQLTLHRILTNAEAVSADLNLGASTSAPAASRESRRLVGAGTQTTVHSLADQLSRLMEVVHVVETEVVPMINRSTAALDDIMSYSDEITREIPAFLKSARASLDFLNGALATDVPDQVLRSLLRVENNVQEVLNMVRPGGTAEPVLNSTARLLSHLDTLASSPEIRELGGLAAGAMRKARLVAAYAASLGTQETVPN